MADNVAKFVDSARVSFSPSCPFAISWSLDDRISVLTDKCIYVFGFNNTVVCISLMKEIEQTLWSSSGSTTTGLSHEKTSVPSSERHLVLDVGLDRAQVIPEHDVGPIGWSQEKLIYTFDCALNAKPIGQLQYSGFSAVAWSPLGCDRNERCLLASLSIDHQLTLHCYPVALLEKWESVADLTACAHDFLKQCNYQINDYIDSTDVQSDVTMENAEPCFLEFSRRVHLLAFMCVAWCPVLYTSTNDPAVSSTDVGNFTPSETFAIVAAGTRSAHVAFFAVCVPVVQTPASVSVIGFLKPQSSCISCLAWRSGAFNRGMLAVGISDGLVRVFSLRVNTSTPAIRPLTCMGDHTLWGNKDDIPIMGMNWLPQLHEHEGTESTLHLAVSKGPAVILFEILTKEGLVIQWPTHKLVRGIHCQSISGQTCSSEGVVYTCGIRGTMQKFTAEEPEPVAIECDVKHSRSCNGIGVSSHGLFMAMFHSPSKLVQLKKASRHIQVSVASLATPSRLSDAVQALVTRPGPKTVRWDMLEGVRQIVVQGSELPEALSNVVLKQAIASCTLPVLYLRRHLLSLLAKRDEMGEGSVKGLEPSHGWGEEFTRVENRILEIQVCHTVNSWLTGRQKEETNAADESTALVMSDWLLQKCSDFSSLDVAHKVYYACGDTDGASALSAIRAARLEQGNLVTIRVKSEHNSEETLQNQCRRTEFSAVDEETPASNNPVEKSGTTNISAGDDLVNGGDERSSENSPENVPKASEETTPGEISISLPAREMCSLCGSGIPVKELNRGTCVSGHAWKRCLVSHAICSDFSHKRCVNCGGCVSLPSCRSSLWLRQRLHAVVCCPVCSNWLV